MRIRIDGEDLEVAREARLALRLAGFVLTSYPLEADYIVRFLESDYATDRIVIGSTAGSFERDILDRLTHSHPIVVLDRSGPRNDQAVVIQIPPVDEVRRLCSRLLVEIFLAYVNRASLAPPAPTPEPPVTARMAAIADLLEQIVQELVEADPTRTQLTRRVTAALRPKRWWEVWKRG